MLLKSSASRGLVERLLHETSGLSDTVGKDIAMCLAQNFALHASEMVRPERVLREDNVFPFGAYDQVALPG